MNEKILVVYATTHGSTQEIAETVAATLQQYGLAVDLQPARKVHSLAGYTAVVLGAPMYMFRLHGDARRFLARHQKVITEGLPLALFSGGPYGEDIEKETREVRSHLDKELVKYPWLHPVSVEIVGGKFDPNHLRFPWSLIPALKQAPAADKRDWTAIRAWAESLVAAIS
jgi:menaquinone-dependent protoporphyrinogen oxidase